MFLNQSLTDLQASEDLVDEKLNVVISQLLTLHNIVEICSHKMRHQISANISSQKIKMESVSAVFSLFLQSLFNE